MSDALQLSLPECERREKISQTLKAYYEVHEHHTLGKPLSEEHKRKISKVTEGVNNPNYGKEASIETKRKMSESRKRYYETHDGYFLGGKFSKEHRRRLSEAQKEWLETHDNPMLGVRRFGKDSSAWKGGISFEPYCPLFNNTTKEKIRNRDNRVCQLCGRPEILNGARLSVHHIDGNKMQGCNGNKWYLASLCKSCNSKADTLEKEFMIIANTMWEVK